jgi:hypothetical protein
MGSRPLGYPVGDFPFVAARKGRCAVDLLQLAEQLYHCESFFSLLGSLPVAASSMANAIQGLITPPLVQNTGYGAYTFFAVFCLLAFVFTFFCIPETAGKTLEQMDEVFQDVSSDAEEQKKARIMREIVQGKRDTLTASSP